MTYPDSIKREVLHNLKKLKRVLPVARAFGVNHQTVTRWAQAAGVQLPSAADRMAAGSAAGNRQWGNWEKRRAKARRMRTAGATLKQIRDACGYKSLGSVHLAVKES